MNNSDIYFILVEPVYKGNVGAVARVINNFGFSNLRIVGTIPAKEDHYLAVHSQEIMDNIQIYKDLAEAIADMDNVIALSRRKGRKKSTAMPVREIAGYTDRLPRGKTAFVFGRETFGLTDEEADLCPTRCIIPTSEKFPSLNLAQSVAIIAYELYSYAAAAETDKPLLAGKDRVLKVCSEIVNHLKEIDYFHTGSEQKTVKQLEDILIRSYTTEENLLFLTKMFHRIAVIKKTDESVNKENEPTLKA